MKLLTLIACLVLGLINFEVAAQSNSVDSLKALLRKPMQDTTRLRVLLKLASQTWSFQPDSTLSFVDKGFKLLQLYPNVETEANLLLARGNANSMKSRYLVSIS